MWTAIDTKKQQGKLLICAIVIVMLNHPRHLAHDRSRSSLLIMWIGGRVVTQVTALHLSPAGQI